MLNIIYLVYYERLNAIRNEMFGWFYQRWLLLLAPLSINSLNDLWLLFKPNWKQYHHTNDICNELVLLLVSLLLDELENNTGQ